MQLKFEATSPAMGNCADRAFILAIPCGCDVSQYSKRSVWQKFATTVSDAYSYGHTLPARRGIYVRNRGRWQPQDRRGGMHAVLPAARSPARALR